MPTHVNLKLSISTTILYERDNRISISHDIYHIATILSTTIPPMIQKASLSRYDFSKRTFFDVAHAITYEEWSEKQFLRIAV